MTPLDAKVSLFQRVDRPGAKLNDYTLGQAIDFIREGRWVKGVELVRTATSPATRKQAKERLPFLTLSGTFSRRQNDALLRHSGIMSLDADGLEDPAAVKARVAGIQHTAAAFDSAGGAGLKVCVFFVCVDPVTGEHRLPRNNAEHRQAFDAITAVYGLPGLDEGCSDVSRACFVSYDPEPYVNEHAEPLEVELLPEPEPVPHDLTVALPMGDGDRWPAADIVERHIRKAFEHPKNHHGQTARNAIGFDLACQLRDNGYSAAEALAVGEAYVATVAGQTPEPYTSEEFEKSVEQAYSKPPRQPWTPPKRGAGGEGFRLTDLGNAQRLIYHHGQDLRYCHPQGAWYKFDGQRWREDEDAEVMRRAIETIRAMYAEAAEAENDGERKELVKHALKSEQTVKLRAMVQAATWLDGVPVVPDELDRDPWLLNVENGTIDLRTGRLRPHDRGDLITRLAPVRYDPTATCPTWMSFLSRILAGNDALLTYLQRLVGYALTGNTGEQMMPILYGSGANGKSTFIEALAGLLGDYAQQTPTDTLLAKKNDGVPNDLARLRGARFVSAVESGEGNRLAESLVKQLTGGDRITARFLRQEFFEFTPAFKLFLATNHKPVIRGTDEAIWRRLHLIPFAVTIPEEERDGKLKDKLAAERSGILNWALEGCRLWQQGGLRPPEEVRAATRAYRDEMDVLAAFLEDRCVEVAGAEVKSSILYGAYKTWCEANGEYAGKNKAFSLRLKERGFETNRKSDGQYWKGLGLRSDRDNPTHDAWTPDEKTPF